MTQFLVKAVHRFGTLYCKELGNLFLHGLFRLFKFGGVGVRLWLCKLMGKIISDGIRQDEVTVCQTLHQGRCTQAVSAVVGEVGFSDGIQARNGGLKFVVHPETAHGIVDGRINHHRLLPGGSGSNLLIHIEEVAITLLHFLVP